MCPKCSFAPIAQCPFALGGLLIFPGAHFPQCPLAPTFIGPKVPIRSTVLIFPNCRFSLVPIFAQCPFSPNAHLPQCPLVPRCSFASKCPFAANTCMPWCANFSWRPFSPSAYWSPNAHMPQYPSVPKVLVCSIKCPKYPFAQLLLKLRPFLLVPIFLKRHLPQIAICPKCPFTPCLAHLFYIPNPNQNSNGFCR